MRIQNYADLSRYHAENRWCAEYGVNARQMQFEYAIRGTESMPLFSLIQIAGFNSFPSFFIKQANKHTKAKYTKLMIRQVRGTHFGVGIETQDARWLVAYTAVASTESTESQSQIIRNRSALVHKRSDGDI